MTEPVPTKIDVEEIPVDEQTDSFRQVRLIERSTCGSEVVLGLQWFDPGGESVTWTADDDAHEVYYVDQGTVRISWDGPDASSAVLGPGDSFFLAPGRSYSVSNGGNHPAFVIWALSSAPAVVGASS